MSGVAQIARRVAAMLTRGVVGTVDDAPQLQLLQVELLDDEVADGVERFQDYGFTSVPLPDAEVVAAAIGGTRSHTVAIVVVDRRHRPRGLRAGDVAVHDNRGQTITLTDDGVTITSTKPVKIVAPKVLIESDDVELGGAGGKAVARVGDDVANGKIVSGSSKVKAA